MRPSQRHRLVGLARHALPWLIMVPLLLQLVAAVPAAAQGIDPAEPCDEADPACTPEVPPPCEDGSPDCNPAFPPPPVIDPPPGSVDDPPAEDPTTPPTDDPGSPLLPSFGGFGFGNPLWFLPEPPPIEFGYNQAAYDHWLSQCSDDLVSLPELTDPLPGVTPDLPQIFNELYGDAEWSCGDDLRADSTVLGVALGGDTEIGRAGIPTGAYDIGADAGAWNHLDRKFWISVTNGFFTINKVITGATINILKWAFGFEIGGAFADRIGLIAVSYYGQLIPLYDFALFATLVFFAIQLMRGRTHQAIGELALTYFVFVVFLIFGLTSNGGYSGLMVDTMEATGNTAGSIAAITLGDQSNVEGCPAVGAANPGGTTVGMEGVVCPFGRTLHAAFVERPYDLINWGRDLGDAVGDGSSCAGARDQILLSGPWGARDEPRFIMGSAGCEAEADFNHDPTAERAGLAALTALTAVLVLILALLTALTLIGAQLLLVGLIAIIPFVLIFALLPGSGRTALWRWIGAFFKVILTVIAMAAFLSLYLVSIQVMAEATAGDSWLVQGGSMVLLTLVMFWVRSRMLKAGKAGAANIGQRLADTSPGANGGFFAAAAAGFGGGAGYRYGSRSGGYGANGHGSSYRRRMRGYIPYEARMAYRDARQVPVNFAEWNANRRERRAIRRDGYEPPSGRTPPRGFTESRRRHSAARVDRRIRRTQSREGVRTAAAEQAVAKTEAALARQRKVERQLRRYSQQPDTIAGATRRRKAAQADHKRASDRLDGRRAAGSAANQRARYGRRGAASVAQRRSTSPPGARRQRSRGTPRRPGS